MNVFRSALIMSLVVMLSLSSALAQSGTTGAFFPPPAYGQPVYLPPTAVVPNIVPTDPFSACKCGCDPSSPGDCKCKCLDCKVRLPQNCKIMRGPHKTPIPCTVFGKVPKRTVKSCCTEKRCDFEYGTEVPEIHCVTDYCNEIGKRTLQCMPGCCFSVCVPLFECTTEKVECKLTLKPMKMELWTRRDDRTGQTVFDVYVINQKDPNSPYHAGGMPARWLILHCGSQTDFNNRFPGIDSNTGGSLGKLDKDAKPEATPADVKIELITDKKEIKKHMDKADNGEATSDGRKFIAVKKG